MCNFPFKTLFLALILVNISLMANRHFESIDLGNGNELPYAYTLPTNFDANKTYPVLIGPGDTHAGSEASFFWRTNLPESLDWILVESTVFFENNDKVLMAKLLDHLQKKFKVEGNKFHTVGFSANSSKIFKTAMSLADRFASITGIPGHPTSRNPGELKQLKNTKIHFIVGENDGYWRRESERAHKQLKELGIETVLDIIPNGGHVLTDLIGAGFLEKMERMRPKSDEQMSK